MLSVHGGKAVVLGHWEGEKPYLAVYTYKVPLSCKCLWVFKGVLTTVASGCPSLLPSCSGVAKSKDVLLLGNT